MSSSTAPALPSIDRLRTRLKRLVADPRAKWIPEGLAIAGDLDQVLDQVEDLSRRVSALEHALAALVPHKEEFE